MAKRKPAEQLTVKTSISIGVRDHALWGACASLAGVDRSAFAVQAIRQACSGLILVDRRGSKGQAKLHESASEADPVKLDGPEDAA